MPVLATIGNDALKSYDYASDYNRDQYFSSVSCLVVGDGANTSNNRTYLDSTGLNTITATGTAIQQGAFSPFAKYTYAPYNPVRRGGSVFFTGVAANYLSLPDSAALELGSGNFCIELFIHPTSVSGTSTLIAKRTAAAAFGPFAIVRNGTSIQVSMSSNGTTNDVANAVTIGTVAVDTWYHIALYRVGTAIYGSVGGTVTTVNGSTSATLINNTSAIFIGADSASQVYTGFISSLRMVVGSSVYTSSNFTPPTVPLTAITNTQLLLNFTNAKVYDAAQNMSLNTIGSSSVSTTWIKWGGGSISIPSGTANYIQSVTGPTPPVGAGVFTIDFWLLQTSGTLCYIFEINATNGVGNVGRVNIRVNANGTVRFSTNSLNEVASATVAYPITYNAWNHIAFMRTSDNDVGVYVNGRRANNSVSSALDFSANGQVAIGGLYTTAQTGGTGGFNLVDLRITPGVVRFPTSTTIGTQAFTPPNGPAPLV
jgi:hypothetical protein